MISFVCALAIRAAIVLLQVGLWKWRNSLVSSGLVPFRVRYGLGLDLWLALLFLSYLAALQERSPEYLVGAFGLEFDVHWPGYLGGLGVHLGWASIRKKKFLICFFSPVDKEFGLEMGW